MPQAPEEFLIIPLRVKANARHVYCNNPHRACFLSRPKQAACFRFQFLQILRFSANFEKPLKCLTLINNLLVKDGYLMIVTPDINSLTAKLFMTYWPHFLPEHLTYFSYSTLKKTLEKSGFETVYYEPAKKYQNFDYIVHRLSIYPKPILTRIAKFADHLIPEGLNQKMFPLKTGEMFILARKKKNISFCK